MSSKNSSDKGSRYDIEDADNVAPKKERTGIAKCICNNIFMISIIIGVLVGFAIGFGIRSAPFISEEAKIWVSMPGDIYINLLKLTILPLISANIIIVIAKLNPKENGKISLFAFCYIIVLNVFGACWGAIAAFAIKPGEIDLGLGDSGGGNKDPTEGPSPTTSDAFADLILNIFPDNIVGIALFQAVTTYKPINNGTNITYQRQTNNDPGTNMIGVIFVSVVFGLSANAAKENGEGFLEFFSSLADVVLKLIRAFLKTTCVGVCFMIAGALVKVDDIATTFAKLGIFIATVVVGIAGLFVVEVIIFGVVTRKNPFQYIPYMMGSWFIAFATTSAIVSVPEMYEGCDQLNIRKGTSRFVAPLAATLKADGSAVFICSASIFICQLEGMGSNSGTIVVIWILTCCLSIAIPHIPSSSIVIIITVLTSVGCPIQQVSLLYATEWLLDRLRTGMSTVSTFYSIVFTELLTNPDLKRNKTGKDEFDEAVSQLSASAKQYAYSSRSVKA